MTKSKQAGLSVASERSAFDYASLEEAFPPVAPNEKPFGDRVLVQVRLAKKTTAGGIIIPGEAQETEQWNTQVGKVLAIGPAAFKNLDTLEPWPEGDWCKVGDFVRVPKWGGDRFQVNVPGTKDFVTFVQFKSTDLISLHTGNPLDVVAYLY